MPPWSVAPRENVSAAAAEATVSVEIASTVMSAFASAVPPSFAVVSLKRAPPAIPKPTPARSPPAATPAKAWSVVCDVAFR